MTEQCSNCRFWRARKDHKDHKYDKDGRCHRGRPEHGKPWPMTCADDWCGEYEPAAEAVAATVRDDRAG